MHTWIAGNRRMNQHAVTITFQKFSVEAPGDSFFYAAIIVLSLMIILLVLKLLFDIGDDGRGENRTRATENTALLFSREEVSFISYGTNEDQDLESGKGCWSTSSSSGDLYDGKICVICYDLQKNCFFIPCGHCITCEACARRIVSEEIRSCPICRTIISKVRLLQLL